MVDHTTATTAIAGQATSLQPPQQLEQQQELSGHPAAMPHIAAAIPGVLGVAAAAEGIVPDPKRQICFDFTKNQCSRGTACKFSHNVDLIIRVNSQEKGICFDFLKGLCTRGLLCRFSHDLRNLQAQAVTSASAKKRFAPICYDFVKNQCTRGEDCKYSHDYSSILFGPRAPGKDPYVICVDFTRGKCSRGTSCRYSHIDPRLLASPLAAAGINPALLAAGLSSAAMVGQPNNPLAPGGIPSLGGAPGAMADVAQAQATLLLSAGLSLQGTGSTSDSIGAWSSCAAADLGQQAGAADAYTVLLDHMQRTNLAEVLGSATAPPALASLGSGNVTSMAAISALLAGAPAPPPQAFGAATAPRSSATPTALPDLANLLQAAAAAPCTDASLYPQASAASNTASGGLSAAPAPTAATTAMPMPFQQAQQQGQQVLPAPAPIATKPLMPIYHGVLSKGPGTADLLASTRETDSPTIGAAWGAAATQQQQLHEAGLRHSLLAASSQQQQLQTECGGMPPAPVATTSSAAAGELPAGYEQLLNGGSFQQLRAIWQ